MRPRVKQLKRSVRLVQHGCVLSETPRQPGPTHSVFDVLAAAVAAFAPVGPVAMLGFAGGGMMAPLRKAGCPQEVHAVDLSAEGYRLYRPLAKDWGGRVTFEREDAVGWLRRQRRKYGAIVEDLSVPMDNDVVKPEASWAVLPNLVGRKLRKDGVAIANLLPTPGIAWDEMIAASRIGRPAVVVGMNDFHNRILVQGAGLGTAREAGRRLRMELRKTGSKLAGGITVRRLD